MNFRLWDAGRRGQVVHAGLATTLLFLCACSSGAQGNAVNSPDIPPTWARVQVADAPPLGTWNITLLSDAQLQLGTGQESILRVRVTDADGAPGANLRLNFALMGVPQDTGLGALDAMTDEDGVAQNTLTAGSQATAFAVRIATPGAEPIQIYVSVSQEGFGSVQVTAIYSGRRDVARRIVSAQPGLRCEDERMTFVRVAEVMPEEETALIDRLPAGVTFAVTAIAESPAQTVVARGCVDGVRVRAEQSTEVAIKFADEAFIPVGQFAVRAELDAAEPAESLAQTLQQAAELAVLTTGQGEQVEQNAEGRFLLDSLDQTLRGVMYETNAEATALADQLTEARDGSTTLDASLQQALDARSTGPLVAIPRAARVARTSLEEISLFAALTLDSADVEQPLVWQARRIQSRPTVLGGNPPSVDLARLRLAANARSRFRGGQDKLELTSVTFRAQLGALAAEVVAGAMSAVAESSSEFPDPFGCSVLGTWLADRDELDGDACDADCLRAVCDRAILSLTYAARTTLVGLDITRPELQLEGVLSLHDDNGDLLADTMDCDALTGSWLPANEGEADALTGVVTASAITDSAQLP